MIKIIATTEAGGMVIGNEYLVTEALASILIQAKRARKTDEVIVEPIIATKKTKKK